MTKPPQESTLVDGFGRVHTSLRVSVTDRCNLRCTYCMPAEAVFRPREELLTFEEITRVVEIAAGYGVSKLRLTGGEPLLRAGLHKLISMLRGVQAIEEIALTTNGLLLPEQARPLADAGLDRLNVSLDAVAEEAFQQISRRQGVDRVFAGIEAAQLAGFKKIRVNAVSLRGLTESQVVPLIEYARSLGLQLRFIEFMPLDADDAWVGSDVLSGDEVRTIAEDAFGPLQPTPGPDSHQPASDYVLSDGTLIGFIDSVTQPFCATCNRLRLTAEGQFRNCLFSTEDWDVRELLRSVGSDQQIAEVLRECVRQKRPAHGIGEAGFQKPERAMYEIGG
ncbi:MAG: GTP 3',8-cyclase MoaA [Planctomycetota bacterium]